VDVLHAQGLLLAGLDFLVLLATLIGQHEELGNLVCVLARRRHFDWTGPVEVEVAQSKGQLLQLNLRQVGVVLGDMEVSRQHATLRRVRRCQEEIENSARVVFASFIFNKTRVNDAARRRVAKTALLILNEEPLSDPLVDHDHCNLWLRRGLVIQVGDGALELWDLSGKHLVAHGITNTVAIDHEVCREFLVMEFREDLDRVLECVLHLGLHDLLALLLNDVFRVVLAELLVSRR